MRSRYKRACSYLLYTRQPLVTIGRKTDSYTRTLDVGKHRNGASPKASPTIVAARVSHLSCGFQVFSSGSGLPSSWNVSIMSSSTSTPCCAAIS